jgi:hypothetical protein
MFTETSECRVSKNIMCEIIFFKLGKTITKNYEMLQKVFDYFMNCMMTNK